MEIVVTMASGDVDTWEGAADALDANGSLLVLSHPVEGEVLENCKTIQLGSEVDNGPDLPPGERMETFLVNAQYAPGMWIKVEYQ